VHRLGSFETVDVRLNRLRNAMSSTTKSMGDTVTKAVDLETRRRTMEDGLRRFGLVRTDGSTSEAKRTSNRNQFQQDSSTRIFLGQLTATGVAITLHAASEMVMVEQPWTPEDIEQIARRIHRIGQQRACRVRMFVLPDTIDDAVAAVRSRKLRMIGEVVHT